MTSDIIRNNLEIINQYKFDGPHVEDPIKDTDMAILNFINTFLRKYGHLIKMRYPIIFEIENGIYDYLAYKLILSMSPLTTVKPEMLSYIPESNNQKKVYSDATPIGKKKLKKMKKGIYIRGFHPIYNVVSIPEESKHLTIVNPIKTFTPPQINQLFDFYCKKDKTHYCQVDENNLLYKFYQYPLGDTENMADIGYIPKEVILFKLSGTEDDFKCYDLILQKDMEEESEAIFLYQVESKEAAEWTKLNLNPYMHRYHAPNQFNIIVGNKNEIFHPQEVYNYKDFLEGQE